MRARFGTSAIVALALASCAEPPLPATCGFTTFADTVNVSRVDQVDLLLVIDDSSTMAEEQSALAAQLPHVIEVLASGDLDGDGLADFHGATSIHLGVVSTDMGVGGVPGIEGCEGVGGDGVLTASRCARADRFGVFELESGDDPSALAEGAGCAAMLGTSGCGFGQPLEASLKALSLVPLADGSSPVSWTRPGYIPPIFAGSTGGHGGVGGQNDGFLRPSSLLAVVLVTNGDDCSTFDPAIFDPADPRYSSVPLVQRCTTYPDALHPIDRYVDGLLGLRSQSSSLVFSAIAGVPPSAVGRGYGDILALEEMQVRYDAGGLAIPSCTGSSGAAIPPRRIVELAQGLESRGASTTVQSSCSDDLTPAIDTILARMSVPLSGSCLPRSLGGDRSVDRESCNLELVLPPVGGASPRRHCADLEHPEAYELVRVERGSIAGTMVEREVCRIRHVGLSGAETLAGWYVNDGSVPGLPSGCSRQLTLSLIRPLADAEIRAECLRTITDAVDAPVYRGLFCEPGTGADGSGLVDGTELTCSTGTSVPASTTTHLTCDPFAGRCEMPCSSDADCESAGLRGFFCDHQTPDEAFGANLPDALIPIRDQPRDICVNPTCEALHEGRGPAL